jgi:hypothetical protein
MSPSGCDAVVQLILANKIDPNDDFCRYNREFFPPEIPLSPGAQVQ